MAILLGCGQGLLRCGTSPAPTGCPLARVDCLSLHDGSVAALDNAAHLLWLNRQTLPAPSGVEALCLLAHGCLLLCGDADCLALISRATGQLLVTSPAGVYPQDLCRLPDGLLAVCGGADGTVRLYSAADLRLLRVIRVPGNAQRITACRSGLHVLCLVEDDGLCCLLCRIPPRSSRYEPLARLPGLPGAIRADSFGGLWVAASEQLHHFPPRAGTPDRTFSGFGLIRHIDTIGDAALVCDPIMDCCALVSLRGERQLLYEGDVGQAVFER